MSTLAWTLFITAMAGGLGGFLARAVPNGVGKPKVPNAPTEAGAIVTVLAGAAAAVGTLLTTESFDQVVLLGKGANLDSVALGAGDVVQAFAAGLVGLKWLVNHQDAQTLRMAVAESARHAENPKTAAAAASAKPREVLHAARS